MVDPERESEHALEALARGELRRAPERAWRPFEEAWPLVCRRLVAFQRSIGVPQKLREDCGQAALLRVWRARGSYRGSSIDELLGWIYRIVRSEFLRLSERESRGPVREGDLAPPGEEEPAGLEAAEAVPRDTTAEAVDRRDVAAALEDCLAELSESQREIVELYYSSAGLTERQVAEIAGVSKSYVHLLRQRTLGKLRACLERKGHS